MKTSTVLLAGLVALAQAMPANYDRDVKEYEPYDEGKDVYEPYDKGRENYDPGKKVYEPQAKGKEDDDQNNKGKEDYEPHDNKDKEDDDDKYKKEHDWYDKDKKEHDSHDKGKEDYDQHDKDKKKDDSYNKDKEDYDQYDKNKKEHESYDKDKEDYDSYDKKKKGHESYDKDKKEHEPYDFTSKYTVVAVPEQVVDSNNAYTGGLKGAYGVYKFRIDSRNNVICYDITLKGFRGEYQSPARTATHVHEARKGKAGPPRIAFPNPVGHEGGPRVSKGCLKGPFKTGVLSGGIDTGDGFHVSELEHDPAGFFADVHSSLAVPGAVRGQLG